jgi:hypothetical protein
MEYISQSTNEYARRKQADSATASSSSADSPPSPGWCWKDTTMVDIKIFLGILIYMGIHRSPRVDLCWWQDIQRGPLQSPRHYMTLKRFEQIKRFLHVSRSEADIANKFQPRDKRWWYNLELLASSWERAAQRYYQLGSNLSIDESMIRCSSHSSHTIKMPTNQLRRAIRYSH